MSQQKLCYVLLRLCADEFTDIHRNGKAIRITALLITGDLEGKLQCPQWWPGQSPWRPFDFCIQGYFPSSGVIIWLPDCPSTSEVTLNNMGKCITIDMITITKQSMSKSWTYCQTSNTRCTKSQKCFWSCFTVVFAQSIEARCWVENEDVIGGAPTGDAPTTSERSAILLPIKVRLMLEVLQYFIE